MRIVAYLLTALGLALVSAGTTAASASSKPSGAIKQDLGEENFRVGSCNVAAMQVSFRVNESYGQLLVNARMGWTSGTNTPADCLGDNTQIWVSLRTPQGDRRYLKLNPGETDAGKGLGPSGSTSPSWATLFCHAANDSARCENEERTRELIGTKLRYEGFTVVAATRSLANLTKNTGTTSKILDRDALDSRLSDAINGAFSSGTSSSNTSSRPAVINDIKDARGAVQKIMTLLAASLSQYTAEAHACESKRTVSQWVQVKDQCQMSFRSESQHDYLCEADQVSRPIRATSNVTINLGQDLAGPGVVKVSNDGWSALVLALKTDMTVHTEAKFNTDRWQITADNSKLDDLEEVARQLNALNGFCSGDKSS